VTNGEIIVLMALLRIPGAGNMAARRAVAMAGNLGISLSALPDIPARELLERFPSSQTDHLATLLPQCTRDAQDKEARLLDRVHHAGAQVIACADGDYPESLARDLGNRAPALLSLVGDRELLEERAAAVVGARDFSRRGAILASETAAAFARAGIGIVSGGASGVDSAAHASALANGGKTVVVLPQGLLTFRGSRDLLQAVDEGRAAILSEFLPDMTWQTHAAVTRNATISAISSMVCVIEPKKQGGSVRTARHAIEHGKRVLVFCDPSHRDLAETLARAGAKSLLDSNGQFDADYLLEQWQTAPTPSGGQPELF
jgi:DNA protecting protein DprA